MLVPDPPRPGARRRTLGLALLASAGLTVGLLACRASEPEPVFDVIAGSTERLQLDLVGAVADPLRARRVEAIAAAYRERELAFLARMDDLRERIFELNCDPDAERAAFGALSVQTSRARADLARSIQVFVHELRGEVRREEWPAVIAALEASDARWEALLR